MTIQWSAREFFMRPAYVFDGLRALPAFHKMTARFAPGAFHFMHGEMGNGVELVALRQIEGGRTCRAATSSAASSGATNSRQARFHPLNTVGVVARFIHQVSGCGRSCPRESVAINSRTDMSAPLSGQRWPESVLDPEGRDQKSTPSARTRR